jgi:hypothetical protein
LVSGLTVKRIDLITLVGAAALLELPPGDVVPAFSFGEPCGKSWLLTIV